MRIHEVADWKYEDDSTPNVPSRRSYVRNSAILNWLGDWLGVNRRHEKKRMVRAIPNLRHQIPARYITVPFKTVYRGMTLDKRATELLLKNGQIRLRRDGIISYSGSYGRASDFAYGGACNVIVEKDVRPGDVFLYVSACFDDLAWQYARTPEEYRFQRSELRFFDNEQEVIFYDDKAEGYDGYYSTIRVEECVLFEYESQRINFKQEIEKEGARSEDRAP